MLVTGNNHRSVHVPLCPQRITRGQVCDSTRAFTVERQVTNQPTPGWSPNYYQLNDLDIHVLWFVMTYGCVCSYICLGSAWAIYGRQNMGFSHSHALWIIIDLNKYIYKVNSYVFLFYSVKGLG